MDPTVSVGGILKTIGGNIRVGHSENFITEACEYTNSFLSFYPKISLILNVEEDHMDFFKDINDIRNSFLQFAQKLPDNGLLIINSDIDRCEYFTENLSCQVITYGKDPKKSDYSAANIHFDEYARGSYDLIYKGKVIDRITLKAVSYTHLCIIILYFLAARREQRNCHNHGNKQRHLSSELFPHFTHILYFFS